VLAVSNAKQELKRRDAQVRRMPLPPVHLLTIRFPLTAHVQMEAQENLARVMSWAAAKAQKPKGKQNSGSRSIALYDSAYSKAVETALAGLYEACSNKLRLTKDPWTMPLLGQVESPQFVEALCRLMFSMVRAPLSSPLQSPYCAATRLAIVSVCLVQPRSIWREPSLAPLQHTLTAVWRPHSWTTAHSPKAWGSH
jgi:hypothetical protein